MPETTIESIVLDEKLDEKSQENPELELEEEDGEKWEG